MLKIIRVDSLVAEQRSNHSDGGGSIPTSTLHVYECPVSEIQSVIERVHYSHSIFGVTTSICFKVVAANTVVGGAIFGKPAAFNVARKYGANGLLECRRFVLEDACERNSESKVLAFMLRKLRENLYQRVLSYADPAYGHEGVIYRACGFQYVGVTAKRKHVMWRGKKYPDRNVHQTNFPFHLELRAALADGSATRVVIPGKHIYLKELQT